MHIIVPIKQVPESEEQRYDPATRTIVREGVASVINAYDKRALTEAIRLRSLYGGSITAITMGPPQAREALVEAIGRGVDRAIHLTDRAFAVSDTLATARTLASAIKRLTFDMLLLGKFSTDSETGQVGPELAEMLDLPQITGATAIEVLSNGIVHVTRETDSGFEDIECPLPVLLTAAEHLIKPAKTKPAVLQEGARRVAEDPNLIEIWSAYDLGLSAGETGLSGSPTWVAELRPVEIDRAHTLLDGDVKATAQALLDALASVGLKEMGEKGGGDISLLPTLAPASRHDRDIWAVSEFLPSPQDGGAPTFRTVTYELAGEAAHLASLVGGEAGCVVIGSGITPDHLRELAGHGIQHILVADGPRLNLYTTETYAWLLANAIEEHKPWAVLLPATSFGRDLAPRVAARLGLGLTGDCIGVELDDQQQILQLKPAFGGQVIAPIISRTIPVMTTIRPGQLPVHSVEVIASPRVTRLSTERMPESRARVLSVTHEGEAGLALDTARLVVCVGMGIGDPDALADIEALAQRLGDWMGLSRGEVAVGGTRKVVDAGWLPRQQQIGLTGRTVAPDLYLGIGVQGNFNHTSGIMRSGVIVAVNNDPSAHIFTAADFAIEADWREFADALMVALDSDTGTNSARKDLAM
ncbi:MAG: FAD-binding protein [Chloroflexota bacterium]